MARANILATRTMDFGELLGNGKTYRVPPYQRDYSWAEEQWEDLWIDIQELQPDDSHYMGAMVVEETGDRDFAVIDGQQRAATLSIVALAIIRRLGDLAERGIDAAANAERAQELRRAFIGEKDPASLLESSKLFLNETDDAFYQDYLVQLRTPTNPRRLPKSNKLLWECFQYFSGKIDGLAIRDDGEALARLLNDKISRQLLFIVITVENEINAYTVFETLNARGIELTTTDLLKNYLFSRVKVPADLDALRRRWRTLISTVGAERFPEFLRYHLQTVEPRVRSQRLFKMVRDKTRSAGEVFALVTALEGRAELFSALSDPNHGYWVERPEAKPFIRELVLFRTRQMTPLLFAAFEQLSPQQFPSVLRAVTVLLFRYTVVSDLNTNALEPVFHNAAKAILAGEAPTPAQAAALLRPVYVEDEKFRQDFSLLTIETTGQKKRLVKYILSRLESDASNRAVDFETDPATIEHVLPENPNADWDATFSDDEKDANLYRLGNLTLMEAGPNRAIANKPYADKLPVYQTSTYELTKALPNLAPTEWTPALVAERQRQLASRAARVWRIDY
ncbi:MAG: DUF262 domain-containing protein [Dehalococcoidia bacterium]|nr:DUF262 domain-containing protein [Dehalococcoidia bacterium]